MQDYLNASVRFLHRFFHIPFIVQSKYYGFVHYTPSPNNGLVKKPENLMSRELLVNIQCIFMHEAAVM
jgi:hypothetical protein